MPSISFSGITSRGPLWKLIIKREKTQTIRKPRKRPFKVGDTLYLYWKMRQPKAKKLVHLIGEAPCIKVRSVNLLDMWNDRENARADGFGSIFEFRDWFYPEWRLSFSYPLLKAELKKEKYTIIYWGELTNILGTLSPEQVADIMEALQSPASKGIKDA